MKTKNIVRVFAVCMTVFAVNTCLENTVFATSISLSIDAPITTLDLAGTTLNGRFGQSDNAKISVSTDNQSGYTLNISSPDGTSLIHTSDSTKTISSIEAATSLSSFSAQENTSYNGKWGYNPSKINSATNTDFLPIPDENGDNIDTTWFPNSTANEYTISIGARINSETAAGTYSNTLVITAVPNAPVLAVVYDSNGLYFDNNIENTSNTVIYDASSSVVGDATVYTKTILEGEFKTPANPNIAYKFRGWSENPDALYATYADESSIISDLQKVNGDPAVTLYAIWSRIYTLQYDGNGADNPSGMGTIDIDSGIKSVNHSNVAGGDTFDLFASNYQRDGYGFIGWSLDANAWSHLSDNDSTNDPVIYGPNEMITAPTYQSDIMTLKAVWVPAETNGDERIPLQNWSGCSALTPTLYESATGKLTVSNDSITALTDNRDGQVYAVARLADENCWLIENLRLDNTAELSTANTNIDASNSSLPLTNVYNSDSTLATTSNYLSQPSSSNAFSDYNYGWCSQSTESCLNQSRLNTSSVTSQIVPNKTQTISALDQHVDFGIAYSYGNYYNWYSATAGYGLHSTTTTEPTVGDVCPSGWHLPYGSDGVSSPNIGGTSGGFAYLDLQIDGAGIAGSSVLSSNKWRVFPNNFVYSGYINNGSLNSPGGYGGYWSSSAANNNSSFHFDLANNNIAPGTDTSSKYLGLTVRCVVGN